ncbi:hypothetical protein BH09BAC1_BH09BAC1_16830 [soil metagenome]
MSIYTFGVYVDELEDVVREIEIKGTQTFNELHQAIAKSFKLNLKMQASFFVSNSRWQKLNEITLGHSSVFENAFNGMKDSIESVLPEKGKHLVYFNEDAADYTILILLEKVTDKENPSKTYPAIVTAKGSFSGSGQSFFVSDFGINEGDLDIEGMEIGEAPKE